MIKIMIIGNLGKPPEMFSGDTVAKLSIAENRNKKDKSGEWETVTTWHTVICFNDQAKKVKNYPKGAMIYIEANHLNYRTYEDKEGITRRATEIICGYSQLLSKKEAAKTQEASSENPPWIP